MGQKYGQKLSMVCRYIQYGTKIRAKSFSSKFFLLNILGQKSGQKASVVDISSYSVGQKSGQNTSGVDFSTCSVGQKSGQKASVVDNSSYRMGQKTGQKASVVDFLRQSKGQISGQKYSVASNVTTYGQNMGQSCTVVLKFLTLHFGTKIRANFFNYQNPWCQSTLVGLASLGQQ